MDYIPAQCARSLGPANQMVNLLIQTLLSSYCELSDPGWPKDCGETATDQSKLVELHLLFFFQLHFQTSS